jgi:predicted metalloprotease
VWAANTGQRGHLDPGDTEEAMNAAASVGDDRILAQEGRRVNVDSFTHGSAAQRSEWFQRGFKGGDIKACNTFDS